MTIELNDLGFMTAGANRLLRRADTIPAFLSEILLYDAILEGVKGNHRQSSTRIQGLNCLGQESLKGGKLLVHRDAQCLECAGGRVYLITVALADLLDNTGELEG